MNSIEILYKLQEIENLIKEKKQKLKDIESPKDINQSIEEHKKIKINIEVQNSKIIEVEKVLKNLETDFENLEYKMTEIKDKMYGGKINDLKQLGILLKEQEKFEAKSLEINTKIENMIEELETLGTEIKDLKKKDIEMYKSIREMLKQRKESKEDYQIKLKELLEEKKKIEKSIKPEHMEKYNYIKSKKNNPVALLNGDICSGCHMDLPIMTISKIKKDELVTCSNCNRILYNKTS